MTEESMLCKVTRSGQITVPVAVRRVMGIEEGDFVAVTIEGDTIVLVPKKLIDKSQAYFWSDAWQQAEREASEDITQGRTRSFADIDALIAALDAGKA